MSYPTCSSFKGVQPIFPLLELQAGVDEYILAFDYFSGSFDF